MVQSPRIPQNLYPDSDGKPMSDNTLQYGWIVRLVSNLKHLLKDNVAFVAGDLLWYPVQVTEPPVPCQAPDAMVVLGRPQGDRGSYKQWEEENMAPQVVFEIISPSNTMKEMTQKQMFYEKYGVLEMFFYEPDTQNFWGFVRPNPDQGFTLITPLHLPWSSPTLNIRFELFDDGLAVFYPNGEPFKEPEEILVELDQTQSKLDRAMAKLKELGVDLDEV
ncbi:MAG: Uma2 family endonuclease [Leptolyngbyaceae bacterium]|nr:Uma2 family endonuclease [Leptolyngbyaceae bacterium]